VIALAVEGNVDVQSIRSNTFEIEWPPKSGRVQNFPESIAANGSISAYAKILEGQRPLLDRITARVYQPATRPVP
jgi:predicted NUDIX family NTP pyrophosphohydrolase